MRLSLQFLLPLFLVFAACGDDGSSTPAEDTGSDTGSGTGSGAGSGITFPASKLVGATGCALDEECDPGKFCFLGACAAQCTADDQCSASSCSARGRCEQTTNRLNKAADGTADAAPAGTKLEGISLSRVPDETVYVAAGQTSVTVTVVTSGPVLAKGGLAYRIDTTSDPLLATVVTMSPTDTVHLITIPTGAAGGPSEPHVEQVYVTTNAGAFPLKLVPKRGVGGRYTADAIIPALGARLPIGFSIVTVPENVPIQEAVSIYFLMNAEETEILAPVAAANAVEMAGPTGPTTPPRLGVAVSVTRIGTTTPVQYVAEFENGFEIPAVELFGGAPASQTQRSLRFEFVVEDDGRIAGTFADTWRGLYNQALRDHTETVGVVKLEGEFVASRVGPPPPATNIAALAAVRVSVAPALRTYPIDSACGAVFSEVTSCTSAPAIVTAECANDLKATANTGESLTKIVADLFEGGETSGGASFSEFLAQCAAGAAACVPTVKMRCAAQAAAIALRNTPSGPSAAADEQWQNYTDLLLQLTGGPQLKAYYLDVEARKTWLRRSQAEGSPVTAAALKTLNEQLMIGWLRDVVDANIESLRVTLQPATFAFMSRAADSTVSIDERDRLLISMVNAWGTAADSLGLAALRYSELYRLDSERAAKRDLVSKRTRELYMSAIAIIQFHQAAGKAAQAASIATGLGALLERQSLLSNTFDELLFARDGEVVISTSVDPNDTSNDVLGARRERALLAIDRAATSVEETLATIFSQQLTFDALLGAANDAVDASQDRMIELCGIPEGCGPLDLGDPECDTSPAAGLCGFKQTRGDYETRAETMIRTAKEVIAKIEGGQNEGLQIVNLWESAEESPSEAGLALLAYRAAAQDYAGALAEREAATRARTAEQKAIDAFTESIKDILAARQTQNTKVKAAVAGVMKIANTTVTDREELVLSAIDKRTALLAIRSVTMASWQSVNIAGNQVQIAALVAANTAEDVAAVAENSADLAEDSRDASIEALPTTVGSSTDPSAPARASISASANAGVAAAENAKVAARNAAGKARLAAETSLIIQEALLAGLDNASEFAALAVETDLAIADIYGEFEILQNDVAQSQLDFVVDELDRLADYEVLIIEQQIELRDRTAAILDRTIDDLGHSREVAQAELSMLAALLNYHAVVASARQERANLEGVRSKKIALNNIIGGPERFMTDASKLAEADRQIDRAKRKLNDWLVALEYFAVRPFFNERMAIALAKSSYELKKIGDRLDDLQAGCGGSVSSSYSEVSVRSDLLGYRESIQDRVTGTLLSPADRFKETLKRGVVPVNQRTRYTAGGILGDLLQRPEEVLSASFVVALDDFANLAVTCNAKVMSVAIKLEGEGIGSGQPTVTLLYEGSSQLYSCQPGISDYVEAFGQGETAFDTITTFQISGRSGSPVAGINEMGSPNTSFSGLPLASRYTILIDKELGGNADIVWSKVTDIKLGLTYDYQDPFPSDSLCGSR